MIRIVAFSFFLFLTSECLMAQVDIKFDPVSLIASKNIKLGAEVGISRDIGLDLDFVYSGSTNIPFLLGVPSFGGQAYGVRFMSKYYFNPKYGTDGFYAGIYLKHRKNTANRYVHKRGTMGLITGYKFFMFEKLYMDIAVGMGRRIYSSFQTPAGDFIDELANAPVVRDFIDSFTNGISVLAFTSRLAIGYRISGEAKKSKKEQEKIIRP